jgi:Histidine kinase-like ATPase domain
VPDPVNSPGPDANRAAPPPLAEVWRWRRVFRGDRQELSALRRWLSSLLPECPARDDVLSVATELGSNAIRHTASGREGGWFAVEITWHPAAVLIAVADGGAPAEPHVIDDPLGEGGRGLLLVRELSACTGVAGDARGRLVWAQVRWEDPSGPARQPARDPYEAAVRDGEAALARRFAGVPAWFGRSTLQWWALPDSGGLVSAPSVGELAARLDRLDAGRPQQVVASRQIHERAAGDQRGMRRGWAVDEPHQPEPDARSRRQRAQAGQPRRDRGRDSRSVPDRNPGLAWAPSSHAGTPVPA